MHIYLSPSANLGNAKAFLLREMLSKTAQAQHEIVDSAEAADLIIVLGNVLPNNAQFNGKKVFLAKMDEHFNAHRKPVRPGHSTGAGLCSSC